MTEKEYRNHPAISRSELWKISESPEKFRYYKDHPQDPTQSLLFGQVVHKLLLEPDSFYEEFAVAPEINRRTKEGKAQWDAFCQMADGLTVVGKADFDKAQEMVEAATANSMVAHLLAGGEHEKAFFWMDEMTGEQCKCRTDALYEIGDDLVVIDYKTCSDASTDAFMKDAIKFGYDFQCAMYSEGVEINTGRKPLFVFIAQEKNPPYSINILQADEAFTLRGYDLFREYIGIYHECCMTGVWWGYMGNEGLINELSLPAYLKPKDES